MKFLYILASIALAPSFASAREIPEFPEARAYFHCTVQQARQHAFDEGSASDVAQKVVDDCHRERSDLDTALRRERSKDFVDGFMRENRRHMRDLAREIIIGARERSRVLNS